METEFIETVATTDEELLERYLEGETISREEAVEAMARGMALGEIIPLFCGSGQAELWYQALLQRWWSSSPIPGRCQERRRPDRGWTRKSLWRPRTRDPRQLSSSKPPPNPMSGSSPSSRS